MEMSFTCTEESWMQTIFHQVQVQFQSVVPSSQFFGDVFNLLSLGVLENPNFTLDWLAVLMERARRVLQSIPEFQALSEKDQVP